MSNLSLFSCNFKAVSIVFAPNSAQGSTCTTGLYSAIFTLFLYSCMSTAAEGTWQSQGPSHIPTEVYGIITTDVCERTIRP